MWWLVVLMSYIILATPKHPISFLQAVEYASIIFMA